MSTVRLANPKSITISVDSESGVWAGTSFLMGPIHPRTKRLVGRRMALAAAAVAYAEDTDPTLVTNGPTLASCSLSNSSDGLDIVFDPASLKGDAVHVFPPILAGYDLPATGTISVETLCADIGGAASPFCSSFGGVSPLEVRYRIPLENGSVVEQWMPTAITPKHSPYINEGCGTKPNPKGLPVCVNGTKTDGWNVV